ncbi:Centrosomal protein of 78 kDa [Channa argus]|uniref:Centrosomal protein of 78 kDa n=1 Tax=Channa argus TaxID=215402 RepID=A0A6G1PZ56_CHAAH|nr:Centrosomal protein of 78 kDa [Channa argus]
MIQGSAQIRRQGAQDFMAYYEFACARQESVALPAVKMNLNKGMLDFNGDRLKLIDWPPILSSISINKHLHCIAISSTYQASLSFGDAAGREHKSNIKKKIPAIRSKDLTFKLCKALKECLTVSSNLKTLQLNGLPLRQRDLITLTRGFAKSVSLEHLSLANCAITDDGLEIICQSVKYSTSIRTVDFTGCNLTWRGAEHMANIIKHQGMQRHGTAWAESLRYRQPQFEGMGGLRRVTLNCNTLIGDRGAAALAHELTEDLWVKAVDLQKCGLSNEGAHRLLESLKTNSTLCVLDIRNNPLVDKVLIKTIIEKVLMNADGQSPEYCWIKPVTTETQRESESGPKRLALPGVVKGKATFRIAPRKGTSPKGLSSSVAQTKKPNFCSRYVPWRAAARAERQRGLPLGVSVIDQSFEGAATVKVNVESDSEGGEEEEKVVVVEVGQRPSSPGLQDRITGRQFERLQMELRECRLRLAEERRARLKAESRLMEYELENARLRDANHSLSEALAATGSASVPPALSVLEDEGILESIESSFSKFHAFLDLLKDAGLGEIASMAGIDKSDFQPLGRPQFSSTIGPLLDGAASLTTGESQDVRAQTYSLVLSCLLPLMEWLTPQTTYLYPL